MISHISIEQYRTSRRHRRLADAILSRAGLDKNDVCGLTRANGKWYVNYLKRNAEGKFHLTPSKRSVARGVVVVTDT